jgi:WD40 repeat protein
LAYSAEQAERLNPLAVRMATIINEKMSFPQVVCEIIADYYVDEPVRWSPIEGVSVTRRILDQHHLGWISYLTSSPDGTKMIGIEGRDIVYFDPQRITWAGGSRWSGNEWPERKLYRPEWNSFSSHKHLNHEYFDPSKRIDFLAVSPYGASIAYLGYPSLQPSNGDYPRPIALFTKDQSGKYKHAKSIAGNECKSFTFSPIDSSFAVANKDHTISLFQPNQWDTPKATLQGHRGIISAIAFSPGGQKLVTASHDGTVKLWDTDTSKIVGSLPVSWIERLKSFWSRNRITSVAYSPNGKCVAVGTKHGPICMWNPVSDEVQNLSENTAGVTCVTFDPEGKKLFTGSDDRMLRIYEKEGKQWRYLIALPCTIAYWTDENDTKHYFEEVEMQQASINSIVCSPSGNELAVATGTGLKMFNLLKVDQRRRKFDNLMQEAYTHFGAENDRATWDKIDDMIDFLNKNLEGVRRQNGENGLVKVNPIRYLSRFFYAISARRWKEVADILCYTKGEDGETHRDRAKKKRLRGSMSLGEEGFDQLSQRDYYKTLKAHFIIHNKGFLPEHTIMPGGTDRLHTIKERKEIIDNLYNYSIDRDENILYEARWGRRIGADEIKVLQASYDRIRNKLLHPIAPSYLNHMSKLLFKGQKFESVEELI